MIVFAGIAVLVFIAQLTVERAVNPRNSIMNNVSGLLKVEWDRLWEGVLEGIAALPSVIAGFFGTVFEGASAALDSLLSRLFRDAFERIESRFLRNFKTLLIEALLLVLAIAALISMLFSLIRSLF